MLKNFFELLFLSFFWGPTYLITHTFDKLPLTLLLVGPSLCTEALPQLRVKGGARRRGGCEHRNPVPVHLESVARENKRNVQPKRSWTLICKGSDPNPLEGSGPLTMVLRVPRAVWASGRSETP